MGLFEKSKEKTFGVYSDMIILNSVLAPNAYQTTHILIKTAMGGISPGMYEYEPVSGSVSLDRSPIGNLDYKVIMNNFKLRQSMELYKHAPTWKEWINEGKVQEVEPKKEKPIESNEYTVTKQKKKKKNKKDNNPKVFILKHNFEEKIKNIANIFEKSKHDI